MGQTKNLLTKRNKKPAYMQSLNQQEKAENFKIIDSMNKKISYLKNPRFSVNKVPILMTSLQDGNHGAITDPKNPFRVEPHVISFVDYQVNGIYEIPLKITNASKICRRIKFIPPVTENFTVKKATYPSKVIGDIAPGMSLLLNISFCAPSFADFDDMIQFITEDSSFKVPLRARRDPPVINLVNPLDCLNSWLGDRVDMAFRCVNTGGDGGFKFFCEKDEDDSRQVDAETIRIGSFTLTPSEFYLYSGNAIDIYVSFAPEHEGKMEENLILACDNQTSEFYKLAGHGAQLDLDIVAVDSREVDFKKYPFSNLNFENANPTASTKRTIKIKNSSPILVPYHWSIYKEKNANKITLSDENIHYRVEPAQGKILAGQIQEFTIYFSPDHAEPYFEFADLIVEDIPINAVRNPPDGLKQFAQANAQKGRIPMPTYVGSNTQFLSIPLISFSMKGQGNSCRVEIDPPVANFEGDRYINYQYSQIVKLKKTYEGTVKYRIQLEGKSSEDLTVDLCAQGQRLSFNDWIISGEIKLEKYIDLEIIMTSKETGEKSAFFYVEIEDGEPVSFQAIANFRGPIVKVIEPVVDLGLIKVNTRQLYRINVENISPVSAEVIIKNTKNKKLSFSNLAHHKEVDQGGIGHSKTTNGNQIILQTPSFTVGPNSRTEIMLQLDNIKPESLEEFFEVMVKDSDSQFFQVLAEVQKPRVMLTRNSIELGKIYAGVTEVVDEDHKQAIVLRNYGNIPATFHWNEKVESDRIIARFEPMRGVIPPKSEVSIYFSATVFIGGNIDELFICDIDDLEIPLGFELHADAFGLNVIYESTEESTNAGFNATQTSFKQSMAATSMSAFDPSVLEQPFSQKSEGGAGRQPRIQREVEPPNKLKILAFPSCSINKSSSQKIILKNLSGIKTSFKLSSLNFEPLSHVAPQQKSEIQKAQELEEANRKLKEGSTTSSPKGSPPKGGKQIRFAPSAKSGSMKKSMFQPEEPKKWNRAILSDEHEQTSKFSSATGETFTQTKKLEKEQGYYLSNNKGIAIVFTPHMGDLPPHSEVPITVTIYNNVCGKFDDRIVSEVKGLPAVEFPVSIGISGSPVVILSNQVGLNYKTFPPTLPIPTLVCNTQPLTKQFQIKNTGIRAVDVNWKIFDSKDLVQNDQDIFNISIIKNLSFDRKENPFKFHYEALEPEESRNSAFEIVPKESVIGSRETQTFSVTFYPDKGVGEFKSIILANPEMNREELQAVDEEDEFVKKGALGVISLNLFAVTIKPRLVIDKKSRFDEENHMNFKYWSLNTEEDAPKQTQKIIYTNDSKADMTFNLSVNGPFEIVKTKSNTGAKHPLAVAQTPSKLVKQKIETMFCLQPSKIVEIHVKFQTPHPNQTDQWPMTIKNERQGELTAYFNNGEQQKLILDGRLLRPMLELLTEKPSKNDKAMHELDLGTVHVDKFRTIKVFLSNVTEVTAKWKLNYVTFPKKSTIGHKTTTPWEMENMDKTDDPDVFEFSVTEGYLKGRSLPLRIVPEGLNIPPVPRDDLEKQYLPQTVLINFRPKANVLYKSKFIFTVESGISCEVILKGMGSYEENHD